METLQYTIARWIVGFLIAYATLICTVSFAVLAYSALTNRYIKWRCNIKHKWNGCVCRRCGKTRDENHIWDGCKCRRCYKTRNWAHSWKECRCLKCNTTRHHWDKCTCRFCGITDHRQIRHGACTCCGKEIQEISPPQQEVCSICGGTGSICYPEYHGAPMGTTGMTETCSSCGGSGRSY